MVRGYWLAGWRGQHSTGATRRIGAPDANLISLLLVVAQSLGAAAELAGVRRRDQ